MSRRKIRSKIEKVGNGPFKFDPAAARRQAILFSDEAEGREATAAHLAFKTSLEIDEALAYLATIPRPCKCEKRLTMTAAGERRGALSVDDLYWNSWKAAGYA